MLEFQNVGLKIDQKEILSGISCSINPGEMVAVIGASGAGKSTLFRLLIGEIRPTSGDIRLDAFSLRDLSLKSLQMYRRQIGIVFQNFRLLPQKTVYENVSFALEVCGEDEAEIRERVPQLLKMVGMEEKKKQFPRELSGGERQRLGIARALVHNPKILIADEPTGNLDPKNAREVAELFYTLGREGLTILIATHDPFLVKFLSPRVIRLDRGKVLFDAKHCTVEEAFAGII